jgi:hypothetical protein
MCALMGHLGSSYCMTLLFPSYIFTPPHRATYLRVRDNRPRLVMPTFGAHRGSSLRTTLTMPHPSKGSHRALDDRKPPTQVATASGINPNIQPKQSNTPFTAATTDQNSRGARHIQASPRAPPPHIINKERKQATALRA